MCPPENLSLCVQLQISMNALLIMVAVIKFVSTLLEHFSVAATQDTR